MQVVLYQPQIPPNTGNVARLCVATACPLHLIRPLGFSTDDAALRRAGLDYWQHLELHYHDNWESFCRMFPAGRFHFYSKSAVRPYTQAAYQETDFLIFGCETKGLPRELLAEHPEQSWQIPMWGATRSLNLSTSVGIVLYEALRQVRGF